MGSAYSALLSAVAIAMKCKMETGATCYCTEVHVSLDSNNVRLADDVLSTS